MEYFTAMLGLTWPVLTPFALWKLLADRPNEKAKRDESSQSR